MSLYPISKANIRFFSDVEKVEWGSFWSTFNDEFNVSISSQSEL